MYRHSHPISRSEEKEVKVGFALQLKVHWAHQTPGFKERSQMRKLHEIFQASKVIWHYNDFTCQRDVLEHLVSISRASGKQTLGLGCLSEARRPSGEEECFWNNFYLKSSFWNRAIPSKTLFAENSASSDPVPPWDFRPHITILFADSPLITFEKSNEQPWKMSQLVFETFLVADSEFFKPGLCYL